MATTSRRDFTRTLLREQCYLCFMRPTDKPLPVGRTAADIRAEHHDYLVGLERSGVLFAAGPFVDETGARHGAGLIILRVRTRAEAETIAFAEPYTKLGLRTMELTPWQRNEGVLNLKLRFADGVLEVDNRTYALKPRE